MIRTSPSWQMAVLAMLAAAATAQPWSDDITTDATALDAFVQDIDRWQTELEPPPPPPSEEDYPQPSEAPFSIEATETAADRCETLTGGVGRCQPTNQCLASEPDRRAFGVCQWSQESGAGQKVPVRLCCYPTANATTTAAVDKFADPTVPGPSAKLLWNFYAFPGLMQSQLSELQPMAVAAGQCGRVSLREARRPPTLRLVYERPGRIVAGVSVRPGAIPWMVSIYCRDQFVCGGSLVSERHVLTAAHCFSGGRDPSLYYIRYGSTVLFDGEAAPVSRIHVHSGYKPPVIYHDIALMELSYPVRLSASVQPVCLATRHMYGDQLVGALATVAGFGDQGFEVGKQSDLLQAVDVKVIENQYCDRSYRRLAESKRKFRFGIGRTLVCAGYEHGAKDACQGDSGGPLTVRSANGFHYQVGIVSFGFRCAQPQFPGIYTAVAHYRPWIMDLMTGVGAGI